MNKNLKEKNQKLNDLLQVNEICKSDYQSLTKNGILKKVKQNMRDTILDDSKNDKINTGIVSAHAITLISLIITIIILIILASIVINLTLGDNGLFSKIELAKKEHETASIREELSTAVLTSEFNSNAKIDLPTLEKELNETYKITDIKKTGSTGSLPWTVEKDGNEFKIDENGEVYSTEEWMSSLTDIYVKLYTDGTLVFDSENEKIENKEVLADYGNIKGSSFESLSEIPWHDSMESITKVKFANEIYPVSTAAWFSNCTQLTEIENIENLKTNKVTNMDSMFFGCLKLNNLDVSNFDTSKVTDMDFMFFYCTNLTSLDLSNFNTSNITFMNSLFYNCSALTSLDLSNFDTSNVTAMKGMFYNCSELTELNLKSFNTSNVTDMRYIFYGCTKLKEIKVSANFQTKNVTNMDYMFYNCEGLTSLDVSNFDTKNVTSMEAMFYGCKLTSLDLSKFNTSNVTTMKGMFYDCSKLTSLDLTSFDTSKVTDMSYMFCWCTNLEKIQVSNTWTTAETNSDMFSDCKVSNVTVK
jgi:surface protein